MCIYRKWSIFGAVAFAFLIGWPVDADELHAALAPLVGEVGRVLVTKDLDHVGVEVLHPFSDFTPHRTHASIARCSIFSFHSLEEMQPL